MVEVVTWLKLECGGIFDTAPMPLMQTKQKSNLIYDESGTIKPNILKKLEKNKKNDNGKTKNDNGRENERINENRM